MHPFISSHKCLLHLTTPLCSGIFGCWVDIPARKQVEPRRLAQRTLTKSLGPTTLPGVSADTSWVTIVSWPIFWRICWIPAWNSVSNVGKIVRDMWMSLTVNWILQGHQSQSASLSYLHLFDAGVPLPHLLHISHQLFIKCVRMLLQHHFQLEHFPNVRQHLTQDFVPICLRKGSKQELEVLTYLPLQLSR